MPVLCRCVRVGHEGGIVEISTEDEIEKLE